MSAPRCGSSARRRPACSRSPPATRASRSSSRPPASASRTSSTSRRSSACCATCGPARSGWSPSTRRRPRRSRSRSSTRGSRRSCTRATRPWPSGAAAALALDRDLLRELLGTEELRELLDADALAELELELQRVTPAMQERIRGADDVVDLLRDLGDLSEAELAARIPPALLTTLADLRDTAPGHRHRGRGRVPHDRGGGRLDLPRRPRRRAATRAARRVHRVARHADGRPRRPLRPDPRPVHHARHRACASASAPSGSATRCRRSSTPTASMRGEFRPDGTEREWCDAGVLRRIRRRSLARLRHEVEPVDPEVLARFLPAWHGMDAPRHGTDALLDALTLLQGAPVPASTLEVDVLPARVGGYRRRPARRAARQRRGRVGRGRCDRAARRSGRARVPGPRRPPPAASARTPRGPGPRRARRAAATRPARRSGPSSSARPPTRPSPRCSPRCGTWCGPVTSPTTVSRRCAPSSAAVAPPAARPPGRVRAGCGGSGRRPAPGAGRSCAPVPTTSPPPRAPTRWPRSCSNGTASSPARARAPKGSSVDTRRCIPSCGRWRSRARSGAGTSSPGSAPRSSRCPARSTGSAPTATRTRMPSRACSRPPIPRSPTARRCRGRSGPRSAAGPVGRVAPPAPTSCSSTARLVAYLERGARTLATFTSEPEWCGALLTLVKDGRLRQIELTQHRRATGARAPPRRGLARGRRPRHPARPRRPRLTLRTREVERVDAGCSYQNACRIGVRPRPRRLQRGERAGAGEHDAAERGIALDASLRTHPGRAARRPRGSSRRRPS